jgi:hypothetical protein
MTEKYIISKFTNKFIFWKKIIIHFVNVETELTLGYGSIESVKRNIFHKKREISILVMKKK